MNKGLARRAVKITAGIADGFRPRRRGVVVCIYHRVGAGSGLEVDLPRDLFETQMQELAASGRVVSLDHALTALQHPAPEGPDPVVVTFDDGTADFADHAMPILERHNIPVTLYVATDFIERQVDFPNDGKPVSWSALRDAASTGLVTIGSHTHTHALLDRLPVDDVVDELARSIDLIAHHIGHAPDHFAYPKAVPGSPGADAEVRRRFRSAALAGTTANRFEGTDPFRLARSPIQVADDMRWFRAKLAGGMALEDRLRRAANRQRYAGATT